MPKSSSMIYIALIITSFFVTISLEDDVIPCLIAQECNSLSSSGNNSKILCSQHSKCFYDLFDYIVENQDEFLTCVCDPGFIDRKKDEESDSNRVRCCYQQKNQFTAFILEVIPGFGAGHLYIGNKSRFLCKCIIICCLLLGVIVINVFLWCKKAKDSNLLNTENANNNSQKKDFSVNNPKIKTYEMILNNLIILFFGIIFIWQFIDAILFGVNYYHDNNDMTLMQW